MEEFVEISRDFPLGKYNVKSGETLNDNEIVAVNGSGTVQRADDASGLTVRGIAKNVRDGAAEIVNGIYRFKNSTTNPLSRAYAGKAAYIEDHETVGSTGTYGVVAGIVVDVTSDGVFVDMRLPSLAAAAALHGLAAAQTAITALQNA